MSLLEPPLQKKTKKTYFLKRKLKYFSTFFFYLPSNLVLITLKIVPSRRAAKKKKHLKIINLKSFLMSCVFYEFLSFMRFLFHESIFFAWRKIDWSIISSLLAHRLLRKIESAQSPTVEKALIKKLEFCRNYERKL